MKNANELNSVSLDMIAISPNAYWSMGQAEFLKMLKQYRKGELKGYVSEKSDASGNSESNRAIQYSIYKSEKGVEYLIVMEKFKGMIEVMLLTESDAIEHIETKET